VKVGFSLKRAESAAEKAQTFFPVATAFVFVGKDWPSHRRGARFSIY
jgi:hypothetical protein